MKFQVHTIETAPEASRPAMTGTRQKYGFVPNLIGVLAESPAAVQAYTGIAAALDQSVLSPIEQQVVALTVSTLNECGYCVGAHSTVATMVRMPEAILAELRDRQDLSDQKLNALRRLVVSVLQHRGKVPQSDLDRFTAAGYTERHLLDSLTLISMKTLSNYANHVAKTPLDTQFAPQAWEAIAEKPA